MKRIRFTKRELDVLLKTFDIDDSIHAYEPNAPAPSKEQG